MTNVSPITVSELRLKHAQLTNRAEMLREQQKGTPALGSKATALSRQIKAVQARADDYARILAAIESPAETTELKAAS